MSTAALPPETVMSALGGHSSPELRKVPAGAAAHLVSSRRSSSSVSATSIDGRSGLQSVTLDPARGRRDATVGHRPEVGTSGTRVTLTVLTPS